MKDDLVIGDDVSFFQKHKFAIIVGASIIGIAIIIIIIIAIVSSGSNDEEDDNNKDTPVTPIKGEGLNVCGFDNNGKPKHECYGGYIYGDNNSEKTVDFIVKRKWNFVMYSFNYKDRAENTISTVNKLNEKGIAVHAMTLEDPGFILDDGDSSKYDGYGAEESGPKYFKNLLDFVQENNLKLAGIHIDVEPHGIGDLWSWDGGKWDQTLMERYVNLNKKLKSILKERKLNNILLSAAVSFKYPEMVSDKKITIGTAKDLVNEDSLDLVLPMIYEGNNGKTPEDVEKKMKCYSDYVWTIAGMGYEQYNDETKINDSIKQILKDSSSNSNFFGTCVYRNKDYSDW